MRPFGKKDTTSEEPEKPVELSGEIISHQNISFTEGQFMTDTKTFDDFAKELIEIHRKKQDGYLLAPLDELPVPVWLAQIQIKATRAKYASERAKLVEELKDTAVYCLLLLEKLESSLYDPKVGIVR